MAADVYFEHKETKTRFKVLKFDSEAGTVTLVGSHNLPWEQPYTKEQFEEWGYRPVQDDAPAPAVAPPPPPNAIAPPPPA